MGRSAMLATMRACAPWRYRRDRQRVLAGHDMKELTARRTDADRGRASFAEIMTACSAMMQAIDPLPKPVVAAVQGIVTAAVASWWQAATSRSPLKRQASATPGVDIGLFCSTPMVALSRNVPREQAMEMLLTGEPIPAATRTRHRSRQRVSPPAPSGMQRSHWRKRSRQIGIHDQNRQGRVLPSGAKWVSPTPIAMRRR